MQAGLGVAYVDAGRFADAVSLLEEVHRRAAAEGIDPAEAANVLLKAYVGAGRRAEGIALAKEHARAARQHFPPGSPDLAAALASPGQALMEVKAYADAEPLLLDTYRGLKRGADNARTPSHDQQVPLRDAVARLVQLYEAWDKPYEAARWRKELEARPSAVPTWSRGPSE